MLLNNFCLLSGQVQNGYPGEIHELLYFAERYVKQLLKPETAGNGKELYIHMKIEWTHELPARMTKSLLFFVALTGEYFSPAMIVATGSCTQAPGTLPQPAESLSSQKVTCHVTIASYYANRLSVPTYGWDLIVSFDI